MHVNIVFINQKKPYVAWIYTSEHTALFVNIFFYIAFCSVMSKVSEACSIWDILFFVVSFFFLIYRPFFLLPAAHNTISPSNPFQYPLTLISVPLFKSSSYLFFLYLKWNLLQIKISHSIIRLLSWWTCNGFRKGGCGISFLIIFFWNFLFFAEKSTILIQTVNCKQGCI